MHYEKKLKTRFFSPFEYFLFFFKKKEVFLDFFVIFKME